MCNGVKLRTWMDLCIYANGGMAGYGFQCYGVGKYICSLCEYPLVFGKPQSINQKGKLQFVLWKVF